MKPAQIQQLLNERKQMTNKQSDRIDDYVRDMTEESDVPSATTVHGNSNKGIRDTSLQELTSKKVKSKPSSPGMAMTHQKYR